MCAAANSQIITKTPVVQIVLTLIARLRIRRRFVLLIPRRGQKLVALLEDIPQRVIVRQHRRTGTKQGVRLNGQLIPRQMRRIQFNRLTQIVQRFFERLIRQAMHQVEVKAAQPKPRCQVCRAFCLFRAVDTPQTLQLWLAKALHADRDTVHARTLILDKTVGLNGTGVGFHRNFSIHCQVQACAHAIQQRLHRRA